MPDNSAENCPRLANVPSHNILCLLLSHDRRLGWYDVFVSWNNIAEAIGKPVPVKVREKRKGGPAVS